jgi:hypothetical protein
MMVANELKQLGLLDGSGKSIRHAFLIACCFLIIAIIEARAGETAAVVLKVDGPTTPDVPAFSVLETQSPIKLGNNTTMKFRHFEKCQTVIVKGGLLDFDLKNYKLSGGKTISANRTRCMKKVSLSGSTGIGGMKLRSGNPSISVATRPAFILLGGQSDAFKAIQISKSGKIILERELNGRVFRYPSKEPDLENGQSYRLGLVPTQGSKLRYLKIIANNNAGKSPFTLIGTD